MRAERAIERTEEAMKGVSAAVDEFANVSTRDARYATINRLIQSTERQYEHLLPVHIRGDDECNATLKSLTSSFGNSFI